MSTHVDPGAAFGLTVRPVTPEDDERLVVFHERLSADTTYARFFTVHPHLSAKEVEWFTRVDHHDREALLAMEGDEIAGVARFDRMSDERAEAAFVVRDDWQNRGVGGLLVGLLMERARAEGIRHLVAQTLPGNMRMLAVLRHCGASEHSALRDGVIWVELDLEGTDGDPPER